MKLRKARSTITAVNNGGVVTIRITIRPSRRGTITNTASVTSTSPTDPVSGNNTDSVTTVVT